MHVYDGWLSATSIAGPWTQAYPGPLMANEMNAIATELSKQGIVDLLDGGPKANPKPSLANGVPTIYTSQAPTELIVFKGQPDFVPIVGTQLAVGVEHDERRADQHREQQLLRAARRPLVHVARRSPVRGRSSPAMRCRRTSRRFRRSRSPAPCCRPSPERRRRRKPSIENSIPQTATVPLKNGPKFTPNFDGPPQYAPIPGTPLSYVVNSSEPVIQVDAECVLRGRPPACGSPRRN